MVTKLELVDVIRSSSNPEQFRELNWTGTFGQYLDIVLQQPDVLRTAHQRLYDMILSFGTEEVTVHKEKITRYKFFSDVLGDGNDAIFGLEKALSTLVDHFKAAAYGYGTEKRVLLLHGPVGSSKSTIVRLLKRGLEHYSKSREGALYSFSWKVEEDGKEKLIPSPMNEDPLVLLTEEVRGRILERINEEREGSYRLRVEGQPCPVSRYYLEEMLRRYDGDMDKVLEHVVVRRLVLSERDRIGIGTFQPKDEKNQDSTELTGDINYRKLAQYGSESDPRAFNFDGEFNVANRGLIEFIEVLKLDVAFLYDLLGASQEHNIKPKKFAQTHIDEVILGHSVAGDTPIPYRFRGAPGWTTMADLEQRFRGDASDLEVLAWDLASGATRWTPVRSVFKHRFSGDLLTTSQKWGVVETTPNHSIYARDGQPFYPEERREILAVRGFEAGFPTEDRETIDVLEGIEGFVQEEIRVGAGGGRLTRPARPGWGRLARPRHATQVKAVYDPVVDTEDLEALTTVLVWYATEGHVNGRNGGIVISQADPAELERVRRAYARVTTGKGSIDAGAKTDSAWRLYLGSEAIAAVARHHCGEHSAKKRLPDFLFRLPRPLLQHAFDELMRTDGTRALPKGLDAVASDEYREAFFEFETISPVLAAQVGTLATLLGHDYSVYRQERGDRAPAYRIRFTKGEGLRGGRRKRCDTRLHRRPVADEWVYDIECVGLHNFVCGVGNVVCHNTNEPEYRKLMSNELMEAFRDRTVKIDVPYNLRLSNEIKIYEKDFNADRVIKHIAPHTLEVAAMWAILTRLGESRKGDLSLMDKLKLYNGKSLERYTEENVKELRDENPREGLEGISPRYIQDKLSNALVRQYSSTCVNPFMVLNELEEGLDHHSLITSDDLRKRFRELLAVAKDEYAEIVKNEVQRAIAADEEQIQRLCANYIDNVKAYTQKEKVRNRYTGQEEEPDERLMRSIEEKIDVRESAKDDFRREIMNYIGALAVEGKNFDYRMNPRLQRALEKKLFEDQKDSIKLTSLVSSVVDRETQEKIDVIKTRLIKNFGYNEESATDALNFVASIFARGDVKSKA